MKTLMIASILAFSVWANPNVGTLVKIQGDVKVYTHPGQKITGPAPRVLFDGIYYSLQRAQLGTKLKNGYILQTGKSAKARIIFKNGDQIHVAEGTAYKISWNNQTADKSNHSIIKLLRGKFRAIISKDGPRTGLKIRSKHASIAVRGTDFYVTKNSIGLKLSVIRGKVALKNKVVKSGKTAILARKVKLYSTSKKELLKIHKSSIIKVKRKPVVTKAIAEELIQLEKEAVKATLKDIKRYDPKQYDYLKSKDFKSVSSINTMVVRDSFKKAPKSKDVKVEDFEEEETYKKYFKVE